MTSIFAHHNELQMMKYVILAVFKMLLILQLISQQGNQRANTINSQTKKKNKKKNMYTQWLKYANMRIALYLNATRLAQSRRACMCYKIINENIIYISLCSVFFPLHFMVYCHWNCQYFRWLCGAAKIAKNHWDFILKRHAWNANHVKYSLRNYSETNDFIHLSTYTFCQLFR